MTTTRSDQIEQSKPRRRSDERGGGGGTPSAAPKRNGHRGRGGRGGSSRGADVDVGDDAPRDREADEGNAERNRRRAGRKKADDSRRNGAPASSVADGNAGDGRSGGKGSGGGPPSSGNATKNRARTKNDRRRHHPNGTNDGRPKPDAKERGGAGHRSNRASGNGNDNGNSNNGPTSKSGRRRNDLPRPSSGANDATDGGSGTTERGGDADDDRGGGRRRSNGSRTKKTQYAPHASLQACLARYASGDPSIVRGKIRVLPARNGAAFVTCDRGAEFRDVVVRDERDRNRAMDGDAVFVELRPLPEGGDEGVGARAGEKKSGGEGVTVADFMSDLELGDDPRSDRTEERMEEDAVEEAEEIQYEEEEYAIDDEADARHEESESMEDEEVEMWHDDEVQMSIWDPALNLRKKTKRGGDTQSRELGTQQRSGKVIFIYPPKSSAGKQPSEFTPEDESHREEIPKRTIVGTLKQLHEGGRWMLVPNNKSLPRFMCPARTKGESKETEGENEDNDNAAKTLYRAEYAHGSWHATNKWPPCSNVRRLCGTCNAADETKALLVENGVDHGEFPPAALRDVERSVKSGRFLDAGGDMGWRPTAEMTKGRRDYRDHRVFTIDPTTAKDLDDALHITPLADGRVEIGVHIADVSHFIPPGSAVDEEALKRATTVYLVNGIVPMLPRPLCEIACSLNENVERLAFSCVWRMNMDGTLGKKKGGGKGRNGERDDIWYGRTIIKSCARLDYATAQNIIDKKVANGEKCVDEAFWPKSRQPTGGHTIDEVAGDVRLMYKVAMARRKLRFDNGALALNGIKLAFQLEDEETPKLCAPYPIRDSNRLIEEFMLLANYLVAQRLITHAKGRALLRNHSPPIEQGMQQVVDVSKESFDFDIDMTNSNTLQESLSRLSRECDDELVVQCVTESLMTPMRPAEYLAAGEIDEVDWAHFALNIPYYTHFTSPIRRYPDVIVHRLLQATLDDKVEDFPRTQKEIHADAEHCNDMRTSARKAQERSDRVFLSLYLKTNPISSTLGVCLGVGEKTFTVFVPSIGVSTRVFLQEHEEEFDMNAFEDAKGKRRIVIRPKGNVVPGMQQPSSGEGSSKEDLWKSLDVCVFTKLEVACTCKMQPPIDVRVKVVGPWKSNG